MSISPAIRTSVIPSARIEIVELCEEDVEDVRWAKKYGDASASTTQRIASAKKMLPVRSVRLTRSARLGARAGGDVTRHRRHRRRVSRAGHAQAARRPPPR